MIFLTLAILLVFGGIFATVLLANDGRNLALLRTALGLEPDVTATRPSPSVTRSVESPQTRKGDRLPEPRIPVPVYAFADLAAPVQQFQRQIRSDPETLCEALARSGFDDLSWKAGIAGSDYWECSTLASVGAAVAADVTDVTDEPAQPLASSLFVSVRGDAENRVTSFRLKLNIEQPDDRDAVVELAAKAVRVFLGQVRWEAPDEVLAAIRNLEEFTINRFGSRLQFSRESGDVPRFNLQARPSARSRLKTPDVFYFDRTRWFPLHAHAGTARRQIPDAPSMGTIWQPSGPASP